MKRAIAAVCLSLSTAAFAADPPPPREIVVEGDAEVKVVPDQVILTIAVETKDKDLIVAKSQNDERVTKVLSVTKQFGIDAKHVQTNEITLEPRYTTYGDKQTFEGYAARKQVVICLKEMTRFEALVMALLKAGTNRIEGTQFQSTDMRKWRADARLKAVRAAKEKATAMAGELGQKLGRPRSIVENNNAGGFGRTAYANVSNTVGGEGGGAEGSFAPGQISINANVTVRFDLAD
jgi:uncharacterized protein YggE